MDRSPKFPGPREAKNKEEARRHETAKERTAAVEMVITSHTMLERIRGPGKSAQRRNTGGKKQMKAVKTRE